MKLLFHFHPRLVFLYQDLTIANHIEDLLGNITLFLIFLVPVSGTSVGLIILLIWSKLASSGESPPCIQRILSSIRAATGRQLKQSVKAFQSFILYLLLPLEKGLKSIGNITQYIHHRNHRFY